MQDPDLSAFSRGLLIADARRVSNATLAHEAPLEVLRQAPRAVLDLLRVAGQPLDADDLTVEAFDTEIANAAPLVRRPDFVALLRDRLGSLKRIVVVEVQRKRDDDKLAAWLEYVAYLGRKYRVDTSLLVLALDAQVAAWARRSHRLGPNVVLTPTVLEAADLPVIQSPNEVAKHVELAVLTALARLARDDMLREPERAEVVRIFEAVLRSDDTAHRKVFLSLLHGLAKREVRSILEKLIEEVGMGALDIIKAEGKAEGLAEAVLRVLAARGLRLSADVEARVRETHDLSLLDRWLARAAIAARVEDVFV